MFHDQYGISASNIGLVYLGIGLGQFIGLILFGLYSDKLLKRLAKGGEMKPEYRLPLLWPGAIGVPLGLILYGWSAQYKVQWIVPILGTTMLGAGMIGAFVSIPLSGRLRCYYGHATSTPHLKTKLMRLSLDAYRYVSR